MIRVFSFFYFQAKLEAEEGKRKEERMEKSALETEETSISEKQDSVKTVSNKVSNAYLISK